jgi:sugar-specific transcriptional regulator TrmB
MGNGFLRRLGLTEKEARAYRELLDKGGLDARTLSERLGDTYPAIYRTLSALESKGWITHDDTRPRVFRPRPPSEISERVGRRTVREVETAASQLASLAVTGGAEPDLRVRKGLSEAMEALESLAQNADGDVFCVSPGRLDPELLQMTLRHLAQAPHGVEWYLNVANREDLESLRHLQGSNMRALAVIPRSRNSRTRLEHIFAFGSGSHMVSINAWYQEGRLSRTGTHAICVTDADVVRIQLEALVESTRVLVGRPVPTP